MRTMHDQEPAARDEFGPLDRIRALLDTASAEEMDEEVVLRRISRIIDEASPRTTYQKQWG